MTALTQTAPLSDETLAEIRRHDERDLRHAEKPDGALDETAWERHVLLAEVDRLNKVVEFLGDFVSGVGGLSVPLPDSPEVARLKATLERVKAVADSPVEHQCERDGRASWVRLRDLQEALQDGESRG